MIPPDELNNGCAVLYKKKECTVKKIDDQRVVVNFSADKQEEVSYADLFPILITDTHFINAGFTKTHDGYKCIINTITITAKQYPGFYIIDYGKQPKRLEHLHRLQNLINACTGTGMIVIIEG